jgi:uncharacterized membrane protein
MATGLVHFHNLIRWIILVLLLVSVYKSYIGWTQKKTFSPADRKTWLYTMIAGHITLLLGLFQWLAGRYGIFTTDVPDNVSVMKDRFFRFYWVEHPLTMIISIVLITLGSGMSRKPVADQVKYRKAFYYFLIALILILAGIPWPFREIIGRPLIPGMPH